METKTIYCDLCKKETLFDEDDVEYWGIWVESWVCTECNSRV